MIVIIGMDFGTTNSGMAIYDGHKVRLLPIDASSATPHVARTALYITNDETVTLGRQAIDDYFEQNVGRPVKLKRVWVGEIEVYGGDMFYVTDVYVWADVLSPGRLFLSIKSGLRDPEYQGTVIGQRYYSLENLIAIYMTLARLRAEQILGRRPDQVVLGRPVRFAEDPESDELAQSRLLDAAFRAGFDRVYLQYEPVAAAYHYGMTVSRPENVLVFDFGGGTLDITVMRLDGGQKRTVLATGGIPVAGDVFDQRVVRAKMPQHFGEGSYYGSPERRLPLPKWIYNLFANWQTMIELQTPDSRKLLRNIAQTADDRRGIEALISVVTNNYGLQMFDIVEATKRELSSNMASVLRFSGPGFRVTELLTRKEFEQIIRAEIQAIDHHLEQTLAASGLAHGDIDAVIRTGGSSRVPAFRYMLAEKFGPDKVREADTFSSVTSGLGIIGYGIAKGEIEARSYTRADVEQPSPPASNQNVSAIDLRLLQRRLAAQEGQPVAGGGQSRFGLVVLDADYRLSASTLDESRLAENRPFSADITLHATAIPPRATLAADLGDRLLAVSSAYRFFLTSAGHLLDLIEMDLSAADYFKLKSGEHICAFGQWTKLKRRPKLLIVTTRGFARSYNLAALQESIEGPAPLQFDEPLPGLPQVLLSAGDDQDLVVALDSSRSVRYPVSDMPLRGIQAINRRQDERVIVALVAPAASEIVLLTTGGFGKRMPVDSVPIPPKANSRGRVTVARRELCGAGLLESEKQMWAVTSERFIPVDPTSLPVDAPNSTRSRRLLRLGAAEKVLSIFES